MAAIRLRDFKARIPKVNPKILQDDIAQIATNIDIRSGKLESFYNTGTPVSVPAGTKSVYELNGDWFSWDTDVDVVRSATDNDRILYTGDGYPKQAKKIDDAYVINRLGVPNPTAPLTLNVYNFNADAEILEETFYLYTLVVKLGDGTENESGPSVTMPFTYRQGMYCSLTGFEDVVVAGHAATHFRFYRLIVDSNGIGTFQLVKMRPDDALATPEYDIPIGTLEVFDVNDSNLNSLNEDLSEVLPSLDWNAPPDDLQGLIPLNSGVYAGFSGNKIYISEPFIPYAFPNKYSLTFDHPVVGLGYHNDTVVVTTEAFIYLVQGNNPEAMQQRTLPFNYPGRSKRSTVSSNYGVMFVSKDGIVLADNVSADRISRDTITREEWLASYTPTDVHGFIFDEKYYGFIVGTNKGFVFDFNRNKDIIDLELTNTITGTYLHKDTGQIYVILDGSVVPWNSGTDKVQYTWRSRTIVAPTYVTLGAARVVSDFESGSIGFRLYVRQTLPSNLVRKHLVLDIEISTDETFRLPGGFLSKEWEFELTGTSGVDSVTLATVPEDMYDD